MDKEGRRAQVSLQVYITDECIIIILNVYMPPLISLPQNVVFRKIIIMTTFLPNKIKKLYVRYLNLKK